MGAGGIYQWTLFTRRFIMANLFYDASKFIIAILFAFYTLESLLALRGQWKTKKTGAHVRQYILLFLIHLSCYSVLCLQNKDYFHLIFFGMQQLIFLGVINLYRIIYPVYDRLLLNHMFMLLSTGLVVITRLSRTKAIRQFVIIVFSLAVGMVVPAMVRKWKLIKRLTWVYAGTGLAAIGVVLILGTTTNGSKISYTISGITFQPSEFVKILFILFLAGIFSQELTALRMIAAAAVSILHVIVLVCSRDLGSAAIFFVAYLFVLYIASGKKRYLAAGGITGLIGAGAAYKLFYHVKVRVMVWIDPWSDITGKGYQLAQSLFAIGTGGWFGLGLCQGAPATIPYVEADFIFSAVAEELGVIYALCLIALSLSCFIMGMGIALHTKDRFYKLTACGISITYIFQVFLTIGGGCKFIPLTGVTLPLVSYGGSSVLTTILMFSVLQGIRMICQDEADETEEVTDPEEGSAGQDETEEISRNIRILSNDDISGILTDYQAPVKFKEK